MLQRCGGGASRGLWRIALTSISPLSSRSQLCLYHSGRACHIEYSAAVPLRKQLKDEIKSAQRNPTSSAQSSLPQAYLDDWELTVGIEIHAQLNTTRKLFSGASSSPSDVPNSFVAPFDLAVPGSLPKFQSATLIPALRAAIALGCSIQPVSRFDRKHYFYHDQPAGYQITQYYEPFAKDGEVVLTENDGLTGGPQRVGIKQVQMEQDTARTQEQDEETNMVDYNRSGLPLIEIISLPHLHTPEHAAAYVRKVQALLFSVGAVATGMEMGGLRADVNISVRRKDSEPGRHSYSGIQGLGQRTEIKNLSTFKGVEDAIKAERDRQITLLEAGGSVEGETRGWSVSKPTETRRLRGKEGEVDYRYLPDADIAPVRISPRVVEYISSTLPMMPDDLLAMLVDDRGYGLNTTDAKILLSIDSGERLEFFQDVVEQLKLITQSSPDTVEQPPWGKLTANWILQELGSLITTTEKTWAEVMVNAKDLAQLIHLVVSGKITNNSGKRLLKMMFEGDDRGISRVVEEDSLEFKPLSDDDYRRIAMEVVEANPAAVKDIREKGKSGKLKFLVGQVMRTNKDGRIEAQRVESVLRKLVMEEA